MKCRYEPMDHNANLSISVEEGKNMKHPVPESARMACHSNEQLLKNAGEKWHLSCMLLRFSLSPGPSFADCK